MNCWHEERVPRVLSDDRTRIPVAGIGAAEILDKPRGHRGAPLFVQPLKAAVSAASSPQSSRHQRLLDYMSSRSGRVWRWTAQKVPRSVRSPPAGEGVFDIQGVRLSDPDGKQAVLRD